MMGWRSCYPPVTLGERLRGGVRKTKTGRDEGQKAWVTSVESKLTNLTLWLQRQMGEHVFRIVLVRCSCGFTFQHHGYLFLDVCFLVTNVLHEYLNVQGLIGMVSWLCISGFHIFQVLPQTFTLRTICICSFPEQFTILLSVHAQNIIFRSSSVQVRFDSNPIIPVISRFRTLLFSAAFQCCGFCFYVFLIFYIKCCCQMYIYMFTLF